MCHRLKIWDHPKVVINQNCVKMGILSRGRIILIPEDILDEDESQYGHSSGSDELWETG